MRILRYLLIYVLLVSVPAQGTALTGVCDSGQHEHAPTGETMSDGHDHHGHSDSSHEDPIETECDQCSSLCECGDCVVSYAALARVSVATAEKSTPLAASSPIYITPYLGIVSRPPIQR